MGAAYFYHLTRNPLEVTLPMLLAKARGAGWNVEVRGVDAGYMQWLDQRLWGGGDGFLPHGIAGGAHDAMQPILLTVAAGQPGPNLNGAQCVMAISGADVEAAEVQALDRVCIVFDGNDAQATQRARVQWKALTDAGCAAQYWSEETGRWEMKAQKEAAG